MDRRVFLAIAAGALATPFAGEAQQAVKVAHVGLLMPVSSADARANVEAFRQGLRELGYIEGQNIAIEPRYSDGRDDRLPDLAADLVNMKVAVIVTWGTPAARAARGATKTIPIVTAAVTDPLGTGLIASLARPGGNLTGVTSGGAALSGKTLELLKELAPGVKRIAVLWNPANPIQPVMFRETQVAAETMRVQVQSVGVSDPNELDAAFAAMTGERVDAMVVLQDLMLQANRRRIVASAARLRLPAVYERKTWVDAGGLMSYGVNFPNNFRRAATYVDKILKWARPGDLPVEEATKFELVINLKTAKELGLTIPPSPLLRADQVIQ
jgi:putative ABC transport system substrate-binding protein